jgi:predicted transcriptional regulator
MDFKTAAKLGQYISKDYAEDLFELLVNYQDISASEAASRLNLHIKTVQDFLDAMVSLDILFKKEVYEKKRPYFRYSLKKQRIRMDIDLSMIRKEKSEGENLKKIREKKNANVRFSLGRSGDYIHSVVIWTGEGRERKERMIKLTSPQGKFLYHLPFPNAVPLSITKVMQKAGVDERFSSEILDIAGMLEEYRVIEMK